MTFILRNNNIIVINLSILKERSDILTQNHITFPTSTYYNLVLWTFHDKIYMYKPKAKQTCTRVARSNWKKNIKISSLAVSLCSELASKLWSPPPPPRPLKSHPAPTLVSLRLSKLGLPFKFTLGICTEKFQMCRPSTIWFWVLLLREGAGQEMPPFWEAVPVRELNDRVCAIVLLGEKMKPTHFTSPRKKSEA